MYKPLCCKPTHESRTSVNAQTMGTSTHFLCMMFTVVANDPCSSIAITDTHTFLSFTVVDHVLV